MGWDRPALAQRAVRCFQQQSYPDRELVIVDDGEDRTVERWLQEENDPRIVYLRVPDGSPLGDLRNLAVENCTGSFVAQWDDDDLSDPRRLEIQMAAINLTQADACLLERELLWWPDSRRLAVSGGRLWEGSFLCAKAKLPAYPSKARGEDTPIIEQIVASGRIALMDYPQLYVYVYHGDNTFAPEHWEQHWQAAGERFEDQAYDIMVRDLEERLNLDLNP